MKIYDVAIVGTGSVGSSIGYYAVKQNLSVLQLDKYLPPHQCGTHHGETRLIRHAYAEGEKYVPLVLKAQQLWNDLQQETQRKIFSQTGVLNIFPKDSILLKNIQASAKNYHIPIQEYSAADLHNKWSVWKFNDNYVGVIEPQSGYLYCENIINIYIEKARKQGAHQKFNCDVLSIQKIQDHLIKIETTVETFYAKNVVVTAGTWVKKLCPDLPINPIRKVFEWFNINDNTLLEKNNFPAFAVGLETGEIYYGFPAKDNIIKIGRHDDGERIESFEQQLPYGSVETDHSWLKKLLEKHLSGTTSVHYGASCSYDISPDEDFIIDHLPNMTNVHVITGLSGHGFKFVSAIGYLMVQKLLDKEIEIDLDFFKLNRF